MTHPVKNIAFHLQNSANYISCTEGTDPLDTNTKAWNTNYPSFTSKKALTGPAALT